MPSFVFESAKKKIYAGQIDLSSDSFELRLVLEEPSASSVELASDLSECEDKEALAQSLDKNVSYNPETSAIEVATQDSASFSSFTAGVDIVGVVATKTSESPKERFALCYNEFSEPVCLNREDGPLVVNIPHVLRAR